MINALMTAAYILFCLRYATRPCKYFQLNARYFDSRAGVFSKIELDKLIPPPHRLQQHYEDGARAPARYPVFIKPEWGQNARGVCRADDAESLRRIRAQIHATQHQNKRANIRYLMQESARGKNEYEIFSIAHHRDATRHAVLTVAQTCNDRERDPINSIHNVNTRYVDITGQLSRAQRARIGQLAREIGRFNISRISVRADSLAQLLRGVFQVIEINLFLPMPINLLDRRHSTRAIIIMVINYMRCLARATKHRDKTIAERPVFIASMLYHRRGRLANKIKTLLRARQSMQSI